MKLRRPLFRFVLILLLIEFADELIGGVREAAWPIIRTDLGLSYAQIGLLLSLPGILGGFIEPVLGILADTGKKRLIILGGGTIFVLSCFLAAGSVSFLALLVAYTMFFPASGAFVSLSQTVLMDLAPDRREQNMARWTFAGSFGYVLGPVLMSGAAAFSLSWRIPFWGVALLATIIFGLGWHYYNSKKDSTSEIETPHTNLMQGLMYVIRALRRRDILRWLVLLEFSDLVLDVFYSYLALYLVDIAGVSPATAALGVAVWTGVGLLGDFLIIPILERVDGLAYLRASAFIKLCLLPILLLVPWVWAKFIVLGLLGFLNAGWYAILQAQLYSSLPGKSGTVMSLGSIAGVVGKTIPLMIGLAAQAFGLGTAMWIFLLGPTALLVGLPFSEKKKIRI